MNILFICSEYPPGRHGGIGSATQNLARQLAGDGHSVLVAGLYPYGYRQKDYQEDHGVKVWRKRYLLDKGFIRNNFHPVDNLLLKTMKWTGIIQWDLERSLGNFFSFIRDLIREYSIEIIEWPDWNDYFLHINHMVNYPAWGVPMIVKMHGTANYFNWQVNKPVDEKIYNIEKNHLLQADTLVAVSNHMALNMRKFYGLDTEIKVLYNGLHLPLIPESNERDESTVIFTGSLSEKKGLISLLKAWNFVHREIPGAKLLIYGKGKQGVFIKKLDADAIKTVHFKGHADKDILFKELLYATAAVFPSYAEGFAMGPMEAMSAACPVIYTKRSSGPELIRHNVDGLLADPDDYNEIAENIITLLRDRQLRERISLQGRERIRQNFSIEQCAGMHTAYYSSIIEKNRRTAPLPHEMKIPGIPNWQA